MLRLLTLAGVSAFALATPSLAQDAAPVDQTAPVTDTAPVADAAPTVAEPTALPEDKPFSGLYVGASGGYDVQRRATYASVQFDRNLDGRFGDTVATSTGANAFSPGFCDGRARGTTPTNLGCASDHNGWAYYGRVGFDQQHGPFVVGLVGEFGKTEIVDYTSAFSTTPASYTFSRKINWEAGGRLRAGFAANTTLFYGTGGGGYAQIGRQFSTTNTLNDFDGRGKREKWGLQAGGGIEQKLGRNFSVGLEYLYHSYVDDSYRVRVTAGTAPATNPFILAPNTTGTDLRRSDDVFRWHSIRATAAFRF